MRPISPRVRIETGRLLRDGDDVFVDLGDIAAAAAAAALARVFGEHGFVGARIVVDDVIVEGARAQATARRDDRLVDPRTGHKVTTGPAVCVVTGGDAVVAAALARACLVAGPRGVQPAAQAFGVQVSSPLASP